MPTIQIVSENYLCSACGACNAVCPNSAIEFACTSIGRKYARIKSDKCVDCGLCYKVCPSANIHHHADEMSDPLIGIIRSVYVGRASDETFFKNAQSGGACMSIISYLFDKQLIDAAVMCRMSYGNPPVVEGVVIEHKDQLLECQKSCYTPVDVLSALKQCTEKKSVAVVGLPCHVEGAFLLRSHIRQYKNIKYLIGLICDRTLCGGIVKVMHSNSKSGNFKIEWRKKDFTYKGAYYPYKVAPVVVMTPEGTDKVVPNYHRFVLKDMFTAPRCRICYDKLNAFSDIVLGDPWGMPVVDWNKGSSLVITRTQAGDDLVKSMISDGYADLFRHDDIKEMLAGQYIEVRRHSFVKYVNALFRIQNKELINNFLLSKDIVGSLTDARAEKELRRFMSLEKLSEKDITRKALRLLRQEKLKRTKVYEYSMLIFAVLKKYLKKILKLK